MEVHQRKLLRSPSGEGCCWDLSPSVAWVSLWAFISLALLHCLKQHRPEKHSRRWVVDIQSHIKIYPPPQTCCISKASREITESLGGYWAVHGQENQLPLASKPCSFSHQLCSLEYINLSKLFPYFHSGDNTISILQGCLKIQNLI